MTVKDNGTGLDPEITPRLFTKSLRPNLRPAPGLGCSSQKALLKRMEARYGQRTTRMEKAQLLHSHCLSRKDKLELTVDCQQKRLLIESGRRLAGDRCQIKGGKNKYETSLQLVLPRLLYQIYCRIPEAK
ncbi:MAG TPA: ATP-binding protein [Nitrososphaera sp.]|nr:ATP-binding protein [Nitrososphaera sp.]